MCLHLHATAVVFTGSCFCGRVSRGRRKGAWAPEATSSFLRQGLLQAPVGAHCLQWVGRAWVLAQPRAFAATAAPPPSRSVGRISDERGRAAPTCCPLLSGAQERQSHFSSSSVYCGFGSEGQKLRSWRPTHGLTAMRSSSAVSLHLLAIPPVRHMGFLLRFAAFCEGVNDFLSKPSDISRFLKREPWLRCKGWGS